MECVFVREGGRDEGHFTSEGLWMEAPKGERQASDWEGSMPG